MPFDKFPIIRYTCRIFFNLSKKKKIKNFNVYIENKFCPIN